MKTNPYAELYETMRPGTKGALRPLLGTVKSVEPLAVEVGGTIQEAGRFYIADRLLKEHTETRSVSGSLQISASCALGSHSDMEVLGGALQMQNASAVLQNGDLVLLLTEDDQTFFLVDKVVHLS